MRLTPSTATDPWGIEQRARAPARQRDPHPRRRFYTGHGVHGAHTVHVAQDEVAAERAPEPQRSLEVHAVARAAGGRGPCGRASPGRRRRRTRRGAASTTVRQTPLTATLAPISLPSIVTRALDLQAGDVARRLDSPAPCPLSSTIPVNIRPGRPRHDVALDRAGRRRQAVTVRSLQPQGVLELAALDPPRRPARRGRRRSSGATNTATRSTSPASRNAPWTSPPPSTRTRAHLAPMSSASSALQIDAPVANRRTARRRPPPRAPRRVAGAVDGPTTTSARAGRRPRE